MDANKLFSIGEFAKISGTPIKTLRYYDSIKLLKPYFINSENHYRYYSDKELIAINAIKKMKYQGFKLTEIKEILSIENIDTFKEKYNIKRKRIEKELNELSRNKERIEKRLELFDKSSVIHKITDLYSNNNFIELKELPERNIAFHRFKSRIDLCSLLTRCNQFLEIIHKHDLDILEPYMTIFYDNYEEIKVEEAELELCACLKYEPVKKLGFMKTLPAGIYATTSFKGSFNDSKEIYLKTLNWIKENGYEKAGPVMRIYLTGLEYIKSPENLITEFQIPIKKV